MASSGGDPAVNPGSPPSRGGGRRGGRSGNAGSGSARNTNTNTNINTTGSSRGGRGGTSRGPGRGRGRGGGPSTAGRLDDARQETTGRSEQRPETKAETTGKAPAAAPADDDPDAEVCFICANPIVHHSIAPCNHTTCHICGLRMRALYKTKDCAHCRTPADFVIFTDDTTKRFADYTDADITSTDTNIGIRYANEDIVGDTVLLLRYNCPDPECDFAGLGWPDLHRHVRAVHQKRMCDLCTRNKKVFTHEHDLFGDRELERHMRQGDDRPGADDQTGFRGHPQCGFCGSRFYDDDKLYEHCRHKHERCFICDRRDTHGKHHYFLDYDALEQHFKNEHFLCIDKECLEKKFVVFESELDLKAHQLQDHGNSLSKDVRRDARVVDMSSFDFRQSYQQERRTPAREGRGRGRGRDPNSEPLPASSAQPLRRDELAFQRQMQIHSAQSVSTRNFGGQLTAPSGGGSSSTSTGPAGGASSRPNGASSSSVPASQPAPQSQLLDAMEGLSVQDAASLTPQERARLVRHGAVIERASNLIGNDASKMATFREHVSSYRKGDLTAPQLVDAIFTLFADASPNALSTLVRELADLFEDKAKADGLLRALQDWRAINEDYPSLPGLGGMHGATTSSSGWATAAAASPTTPAAAPSQKHSTRVLRLKNSTRRGSASSAGSASSWTPGPAVTARPPQPPPTAFPALPRSSATATTTTTLRPSWAGVSSPGSGRTSNVPRPSGGATPSARSEEAFPALPAAPKPQTTIFGYGTGAVRRDVGANRNTGFSWGGQGQSSSGPASGTGTEAEDEAEGQGKKKKGNKGKKQVLVQWG